MTHFVNMGFKHGEKWVDKNGVKCNMGFGAYNKITHFSVFLFHFSYFPDYLEVQNELRVLDVHGRAWLGSAAATSRSQCQGWPLWGRQVHAKHRDQMACASE